MIGTTHRIDNRASVIFGVGYNWGSVGSADASANVTRHADALSGEPVHPCGQAASRAAGSS